jgi:hypothetical protein
VVKKVIVPSREPIGRFIASSFEVLERLLNRVSPGGHQMSASLYAEPAGPLSHRVLSATTSWYAPLMRLKANSTSEHEQDLLELVDGFIGDIECGIVYSSADHFATQMSFITSGHAERAVIDYQARPQNRTRL